MGLPFSEDACLTSDDPITIKMWKINNSPEGRSAAVEATKNGEAAMAKVDPLLQVALKSDYGSHNMGTATAGSLVGRPMLSLGYKNSGTKALPSHRVAKTAARGVGRALSGRLRARIGS